MNYSERVVKDLESRCADQPEFIQAAREVLLTLQPNRITDVIGVLLNQAANALLLQIIGVFFIITVFFEV